MTIQTFIEKAIEGGWDGFNRLGLSNHWNPDYLGGSLQTAAQFHYAKVLLDPLAWQAVGKVEGWGTQVHSIEWVSANKKTRGEKKRLATKFQETPQYLYHMHRMVDAFAEGKTTEEFLSTL